MHSIGQPMLGGISIGDAACFGGPTLALAVAAIVEDQNRRVQGLAEHGRELAERRHIRPVAMAIQNRTFWVGMCHEPPVQLRSISGFERYVLVLKAGRMP